MRTRMHAAGRTIITLLMLTASCFLAPGVSQAQGATGGSRDNSPQQSDYNRLAAEAYKRSWDLYANTRNGIQAVGLLKLLQEGADEAAWKELYPQLPSDLQRTLGPCMETTLKARALIIQAWTLEEESRDAQNGEEQSQKMKEVNRLLQEAAPLLKEAGDAWFAAYDNYIQNRGRSRPAAFSGQRVIDWAKRQEGNPTWNNQGGIYKCNWFLFTGLRAAGVRLPWNRPPLIHDLVTNIPAGWQTLGLGDTIQPGDIALWDKPHYQHGAFLDGQGNAIYAGSPASGGWADSELSDMIKSPMGRPTMIVRPAYGR